MGLWLTLITEAKSKRKSPPDEDASTPGQVDLHETQVSLSEEWQSTPSEQRHPVIAGAVTAESGEVGA